MRRLSGFSLMEMMVVLMIVAIIAAVAAPMMSKKAVKSATDGSPWSWVQGGTSIWFNNGTAILGRANLPDNANNSNLYIDSNLNGGVPTPHIAFVANGTNPMYMTAGGNGRNVWISNQNLSNSTTNSVAIGLASANGPSAVAVGSGARANFDDAIAIGSSAHADIENSIAIGRSTFAGDVGGIAIGNGSKTDNGIAIGGDSAGANNAIVIGSSKAPFDNSVAIGNGIQTTAANEIRLGDENSTVVVDGTLKPNILDLNNLRVRGNLVVDGNLVVGGNSLLGKNSNSLFFVRESNKSQHGGDGTGSIYFFKNLAGSSYMKMNGPSATTVGSRVYNELINLSDRRLKNVGKSFTAGLAEIKKLEVFNYTFKDDKSKTPRVGVMAQDLQKIFPNAVIKGDDGFLRIRMEDMFYALVNAVKELDNKINSNSIKIKELEKQNAEQQETIQKLIKRIEALES